MFTKFLQSPIPFLTSPFKGEERSNFPPPEGEGKSGGGIEDVYSTGERLLS